MKAIELNHLNRLAVDVFEAFPFSGQVMIYPHIVNAIFQESC